MIFIFSFSLLCKRNFSCVLPYVLSPPMILFGIEIFSLDGVDFFFNPIYWNHVHLGEHNNPYFYDFILIFTHHMFSSFVLIHGLLLHILSLYLIFVIFRPYYFVCIPKLHTPFIYILVCILCLLYYIQRPFTKKSSWVFFKSVISP